MDGEIMNDNFNGKKHVSIVGAGPAGLACAIVLAQAGRDVVVYDRKRNVGTRFHDDFQGLENWTAQKNVLFELEKAGVAINFEHHAVASGTAYDAWGQSYNIESSTPLYYLVRRGQRKGSLDLGLLSQATALGVDVRFDKAGQDTVSPDILAIGPRTADAIATGYVFETDMPDGNWICFNDELAPLGYAYLLICQGRGTLASCMFTGFKDHQTYVDRSVAFFEQKTGFRMVKKRRFGGYANFRLPKTAVQGGKLVIGEQAGFQDALAGFGMGYALRSGVLAAQSLIDGTDYTALWRRHLLPNLHASVCNRFVFNIVGKYGHRYALARHISNGDAMTALKALYRPWWLSRLLLPAALWRYRMPLRDKSCDHIDCTCIWCEHAVSGHSHGSDE